MKWFERFEVRMVLLTCIAVVVLANLYLAWEPYAGFLPRRLELHDVTPSVTLTKLFLSGR